MPERVGAASWVGFFETAEEDMFDGTELEGEGFIRYF
jgi:hypothetical protein